MLTNMKIIMWIFGFGGVARKLETHFGLMEILKVPKYAWESGFSSYKISVY
jgi:hypothetical protein